MKRVYAKGWFPKGVLLITSDVRPVELSDGRVVLLTGVEWCANATDARRLECARAIAYDEERGHSRAAQRDAAIARDEGGLDVPDIFASTIVRRCAEMAASGTRIPEEDDGA